MRVQHQNKSERPSTATRTNIPSTSILFWGIRFDDATEDSMDDHMSSFSVSVEEEDIAEPGRSVKIGDGIANALRS